MEAIGAKYAGRLCGPGPVDQRDVLVVRDELMDDIGYFAVARPILAHGVQQNRTRCSTVEYFAHLLVVVSLVAVVVAPKEHRNCVPVVVRLLGIGLGRFGNQSLRDLDTELDETTGLSGDFDGPPEQIQPPAHFAAEAALGAGENRIANHQQTVTPDQFADLLGYDSVGRDRSGDDDERFEHPVRATALRAVGRDRIRQRTDTWNCRYGHRKRRWSWTSHGAARATRSRQSDEGNPQAAHLPH